MSNKRMSELKPSDFISTPINSIMQKFECEQIARNIMVVRSRIGDNWLPIGWNDYVEALHGKRQPDTGENNIFDQVNPLVDSQYKAMAFSPIWRHRVENLIGKPAATLSKVCEELAARADRCDKLEEALESIGPMLGLDVRLVHTTIEDVVKIIAARIIQIRRAPAEE